MSLTGSSDDVTRIENPNAAVKSGPARTGDDADTVLNADRVAQLGASGPPPSLARRYEGFTQVGRGGMGVVYRAYDPRLGRTVAIKLIRDSDPSHVTRFLREARAQARVVHENVCRVYEAGQADGDPFVVMQFIDGESLSKVKAQLTLEQQVRLVRDVAAAMHEAHRIGLIHRDLKPQNIMVETQEDGAPKPYVVDFGIAREVAAEGQTMTGEVIGTPSYMSPEQALGRVRSMDRRSDVYSLGATLYALLAERPPFEGETAIEILHAVVNEEPAPLRRIKPSLPVDLETITARCLAKEPGRRYPSARALADDLSRWLDSEPIEARPTSQTYRLVLKAKKHKALVATAAAALLVVLVFSGVALRAKWRAAEQAAIAEQLGQDVEAMGQFLRYAYALPLHDPVLEKALVLGRMRAIEARMVRMGPAGKGPSHYALGRGFLSLHRYEEARKHLDAAWSSGHRTASVEYALGLVLGELYQKARAEAQRLPDPKMREARLRDAEESYLVPAQQHVERSRAAHAEVESPLYVEGLIAFYAKRYDEARDRAQKAREASPWLPEPAVLEGDIAHAEGEAKRARGEHDAAFRDYDRAEDAYRAAAEMARSDASVHLSWTRLLRDRIEAEVVMGRPSETTFQRADAVSAAALAADPMVAEAYVLRSIIYSWWGWHQERARKDPRPALAAALAAAEQAVEREPASLAYDALGNIHGTLARYEAGQGEDPRPSLKRSRANLEKAIALDGRFAWPWNDLGAGYLLETEYDSEHGLDPAAAVEAAVRAFRSAAALDPTYVYAPLNECLVLARSAEHKLSRGASPDADLDRAIPRCEEAARLDPNLVITQDFMAMVHLFRARDALARGADPGPALDRAAGILERVVAEQRADTMTHFWQGVLHLLRGRSLFEQQRDPAAEVAAGRAAVMKIASEEPEALLIDGELATLAGRAEARAGREPGPSFEQARAALDKVASLRPKSAEVHVAIAALNRSSAAFDLGGEAGAPKAPARPSTRAAQRKIERGLEAAKAALSIAPGTPTALAEQGMLGVLLARTGEGSARGRDAAREASAALEEAVRGNALLRRTLSAWQEEARRLAEAR